MPGPPDFILYLAGLGPSFCKNFCISSSQPHSLHSQRHSRQKAVLHHPKRPLLRLQLVRRCGPRSRCCSTCWSRPCGTACPRSSWLWSCSSWDCRGSTPAAWAASWTGTGSRSTAGSCSSRPEVGWEGGREGGYRQHARQILKLCPYFRRCNEQKSQQY